MGRSEHNAPRRLDFATYPPEHPQAGQHITRDRVCHCGREYTQYRLSEAFIVSVSQLSLFGEAALGDECPDGWVPHWCPACDHKALARPPEPRPHRPFNPRRRRRW